MKQPHIDNRRSTAEPEPLPVDPIEFDMFEHGERYRRSYGSRCRPNDIQHILFVLDTSTSIGRRNFDRVTAALSKLVVLFCKPIKVAVMTFDHEFYVEFCFDCFDNTCAGRVAAGDAVRSIPYYRPGSSGVRFTHTGGATQCICDYVLTSSCGIYSSANCIDVVYITDGRSNDPRLNVCKVVKCLHNQRRVNTYAIGIARADPVELQCIIDDDINQNVFHLFNFDSFDDFEDTIDTLIEVLQQGGTDYVCVDPQTPLGTESCIFV